MAVRFPIVNTMHSSTRTSLAIDVPALSARLIVCQAPEELCFACFRGGIDARNLRGRECSLLFKKQAAGKDCKRAALGGHHSFSSFRFAQRSKSSA